MLNLLLTLTLTLTLFLSLFLTLSLTLAVLQNGLPSEWWADSFLLAHQAH